MENKKELNELIENFEKEFNVKLKDFGSFDGDKLFIINSVDGYDGDDVEELEEVLYDIFDDFFIEVVG